MDWSDVADTPRDDIDNILVDTGYYDSVRIVEQAEVNYQVAHERVILPNNLYPPLPRVGWKAILLALCSTPGRVLRWWRKLDKIDEQTFDKVPR